MEKLALIVLLIVFFIYNKNLLSWESISVLILKILFLYVFIYGTLEYFEFLTFLKKFLIDILMAILLLGQVQKSKFIFPGIKWFYLLSGFIFLSAILSFSSLYSTFTYFRTFLYPYIIFLVIYNIQLSKYEWIKFNIFIFSLYILQIAASIVKYIYIGPTEKIMIGTLSVSGGNFSTTVPLVAIAFIFSYFIVFKQDIKFILLIIGFLFMGFVGSKRGIWIYTPIVLIITLFFYRKSLSSSFSTINNRRLIVVISFVLLFSSFVLVLGTKYTRSLNPENRLGGNFDIGFLQEYAMEYTFKASPDGQYTHGRGANFLSVVKQMLPFTSHESWFGYGPESSKGVLSYNVGIWSKLKVNGPVTGLTYHIVQIGIVANMLIILISIKVAELFLNVAKRESQEYWKAFSFGAFMIVIVFIIDFLTYSTSFISALFPLSFTMAYVSAIVLKRKKIQDRTNKKINKNTIQMSSIRTPSKTVDLLKQPSKRE